MGTWLAVASGTVAGLGSAWLGLWLFRQPPVPAPAVAPIERPSMAALDRSAVNSLPLRSTEAQCAPSGAADARTADDKRAEEEAARRPTEEDVARDSERAREFHRARLVAHQQEPRDTRWAGEHESALGEGLKGLTVKALATVENVECRSVSCVATLSWPDEGTARSKMWDVVSGIGATSPGSSSSMTLEAGDGRGPTKASLILDWTGASALADER